MWIILNGITSNYESSVDIWFVLFLAIALPIAAYLLTKYREKWNK